MYTFLSIIYVLVCLFLIFVVLLQPGRGGGMGASLGGGSSQTVFGASGAGNFLTRLTTLSATMFMVLSVVLAYMSSSSDKSLEQASEAARVKQAAKARQEAKAKQAAKPEQNKAAVPGVELESASPGVVPVPPPSAAEPTPAGDVEKPAVAPEPKTAVPAAKEGTLRAVLKAPAELGSKPPRPSPAAAKEPAGNAIAPGEPAFETGSPEAPIPAPAEEPVAPAEP